MILPLKYYREFGWLKTANYVFKGMMAQLFGKGSFRKRGTEVLSKPLNIPRLKRDEKGNSFCVSCEVCSKICPSSAISIELPKNIQMPKSLTEGPAPKNFVISEEKCIRCSLCVEVCPVEALTSTSF